MSEAVPMTRTELEELATESSLVVRNGTIRRLLATIAERESDITMYRDDADRQESRLKLALDDLRCPDCGCADEIDAQSAECGCDNPLCMRNDGKSLAQAYLDLLKDTTDDTRD